MKKNLGIGILLAIFGFALSILITFFFTVCGNGSYNCSLPIGLAYMVGIFYVVAGVGIGIVASNYLSKS